MALAMSDLGRGFFSADIFERNDLGTLHLSQEIRLAVSALQYGSADFHGTILGEHENLIQADGFFVSDLKSLNGQRIADPDFILFSAGLNNGKFFFQSIPLVSNLGGCGFNAGLA